MGKSIKTETKRKGKPNRVYDFFMRHLEIVALMVTLQIFWKADYSWEFWTTIVLVAICSGISRGHEIDKTKNETEKDEQVY